MMHHPNMHHQPMSGHPPQHLPGHQGMPAHHQMPPHQMHRENRHVTLTRVPLGPGGGLGAHSHGSALGGMGLGPPPHHAPQRPPHPIRAMPHHPPAQHHTVPQQMKPLRRQFVGGGGYGPGAGVLPPPYQPEHKPEPAPHPPHTHTHPATHTVSDIGLRTPSTPILSALTKIPAKPSDFGASVPASSPSGEGAAEGGDDAEPAQANSKEKTPMCLVNELARYNKIKHQYRLTSETGPAHKKVFTVTLRLGDTEEYTAEGSSIKRAQHAAAGAALAGTSFPPPPPRAHHAAPAHHHHRHSVMPTVELNALAMKLCQPAVYTSVPPVPAAGRRRPPAPLPHAPYRMHPPFIPPAYQRMLSPGLIYRVRVSVGGRGWLGEGSTPQAARHDAAARALHELRPPAAAATAPATAAATATASATAPAVNHAEQDKDSDNGESGGDPLTSEVKSPVSLVHELALKRNLSVQFSVKSERGPPHMRVFVTACIVGDMETEGEGNGKKVSKRRAAERMLDELRRRWPPALLAPRPAVDKRKPQPAKKKPRNLIKEGGVCSSEGAGGADNPISRLAVARHAARARSPQYRVLEERGAARRREFLVQCDAPPHSATGLGPNKKTAKRRAAHNVLLAMEADTSTPPANPESIANGNADASKNNTPADKRKEGESAASDVRQPVPGVLLMDYHQRSGQPTQPNGVSETSATGGGNTPGAKDQLMYLSQLLGFTVQFSDFPKRNHGEYLSLVSLSTEPPVMCHGGGPSTHHSHEQCSRAALRSLALMGLDAPHTAAMASMPGSGTATKPNVISNGISE